MDRHVFLCRTTIDDTLQISYFEYFSTKFDNFFAFNALNVFATQSHHQMGVNRRVCSQKRMICDLCIRKYNIRRTGRVKISKTIITTKLILCMRYSTHFELSGKIVWSENDLQTFYATKFQGASNRNLSVNLGCETKCNLRFPVQRRSSTIV